MRLAALALLPFAAVADQATVAWDHPLDTVSYRLYLGDAVLQETTQKTAEITLPPAGGSLTVTAFSAEAESARSNAVVIPAAPTGVTVTITLGAQ